MSEYEVAAKLSKDYITTRKLDGFGILFAWHTILIFAPLITSSPFHVLDVLWLRQIVLCFSIAAAFALYPLLFQPLFSRISSLEIPSVFVFFGIACLGTTSTTVMLCTDLPAPYLVANAIAGLSEGILMMFWLTNYYSISGYKTNVTASLHAVAGTLAAFLLGQLSFLAAVVVISILPLIAASLYIRGAHLLREADNFDCFSAEGDDADSVQLTESNIADAFKRSRHHFELMIILTIVFGLSFGMVQSIHLETEQFLIGATNPLALLGATAAYLLIAAFLDYRKTRLALIIVLAISFIAFSIGAMGVSVSPFESPSWTISCGIVIAGFHFFDFAVLAITISVAQSAQSSPILRIGINRAAVYFGYGLSFLLGHVVFSHSSVITESQLTGFLLVPIITILAVYVWFTLSGEGDVPPSGIQESAEQENEHEQKKIATTSELGNFENACATVADQYHLTPRETDVLRILAKGRNAAYIAQELWISTLTAKTHIANIYRKLGVHSLQDLLDVVEEFK